MTENSTCTTCGGSGYEMLPSDRDGQSVKANVLQRFQEARNRALENLCGKDWWKR